MDRASKREYWAGWRKKNRLQIRRNNKKWRDSRSPELLERARKQQAAFKRDRKAIIEKAKSVPCMDCGKEFPHYVMDFDHVRGTKNFCIAVKFYVSIPVLMEEIAKCDVVCANCHRIRTYARIKR